jgi:hypothetical protein
MAIDYDNQRKYLNSLIQQGGGKGEWAKQQAKKYSQQYEGFSLNDPQPSHQAWINNPQSGQGGMDNYVAKQQGKYNNAMETGDQNMLSRLNADMGRVGYTLNDTAQQTRTNVGTNVNNVNYWDENQRRMAENTKAKADREVQAKADAEVQAQAEALARQNAYNQSLRANEARRDQALQGIDSAYRESAQGLDNDYFQRYLMNQQQQVANGLNAGIAGDMDTRLGMSRQGDLANIYRDTQGRRLGEQARFANESQRLQEALNLTDAEKLARTAELENMLKQQGFQNYLAERGMNMEDFFRTAQTDLSNRQFNWGTQMDWANVFGEWNAGMPSWFQGSMPNGTVLNNYMRNGGGF